MQQVAHPPNARAAANALAALLSACTRRPAEKPRSMAIEAMPMPSAAPVTMPANSASPELSAMVFCV
eukprot:4935109-Alexandrium_andersonii.AAC.1